MNEDSNEERRGIRSPEYSDGETPSARRAAPKKITINEIVEIIPKNERERLIFGYDLRKLARVFEDAEAMATVDSFLENGMNISETARKLYMHRNTLMYRLNKIREITGLDLHNFDSAATFKILRALYEIK